MCRKTMDDIPHLSEFQTVLRSADRQYPFATLKRREGNEEKIKYIVQEVNQFLRAKFRVPNVEQNRKFFLYLVLNAELPELEKMSGLAGVGALLRTLPALPGPLLNALLRETVMRLYLYDMVAFCRPALALQLADACVADMQSEDEQWCFEHPARLACALYRLTCRLHFARAPPAGAPAAALAGLRACLVELDRLYRLYRHSYMRVYKIFECTFKQIQICFHYFTSIQKFKDYAFADIYRVTHEPNGFATESLEFKICDSPDRAISESLRACNALFLDHLAALVANVRFLTLSVQSCAFFQAVLQRDFNEICLNMNAVLRCIPDAANHRLVGMLERIAIKPFEPSEPSMNIDTTNPDKIAVKIWARDASSAAWLNALLNHKLLCCHPTLLQLFLSEAATLDEDQSAQLFENITRLSNGFTEDAALHRRVAIEAFRRCSDSKKIQILAEQFRKYFHDDLMTVDFEAALNETFDRLAAGEAGPGDALAVFVQNPGRTLERLVRAAGTSSAQTEPMLRIVERLGECHGRCYRGQSEQALVLAVNAALEDAAAAEDDARRRHLRRFVEELVRRLLLRKDLLRQSTPEARAAATANKEHKNKSLEELRTEDLTAGSCKGQEAASFGQPDEAKLLSGLSSPGQDSCSERVTSVVYKCSACGLCFHRHEAMYKHFTNCVPLKKMTRIHCICGLEFDRNNYDYHCEVHRKSIELVKKTLRIDDDLDIDVREMTEDFAEDDEKFGMNVNQEIGSAAHKFNTNFVPVHDKHTTTSTDFFAEKVSVVYRCTCELCFERPDFLFNHINNSSCAKKVTRINCVCGLEFDKHNYDYHCEIHRNYSVLRVKKITIIDDEIIVVPDMMHEVAEDEERTAVKIKEDAQVQPVDQNRPLFGSTAAGFKLFLLILLLFQAFSIHCWMPSPNFIHLSYSPSS